MQHLTFDTPTRQPAFGPWARLVQSGKAWRPVPSGSKDSNNGVLGSKYLNMNGIWFLKPYNFLKA